MTTTGRYRYLRANLITVPLRQSQLRSLSVGSVVLVKGDDGIPDRKATVIEIDGRNVRLQFAESLQKTA